MLRAYSEDACSAISDGRFSGATISTPLSVMYVSPGLVSSQLPPASAARSTITLPGFISSTAVAGISFGAGRPGHERGRDDHVRLAHLHRQRVALDLLLLGRQLARVAARGLRVAEPLDLEELRAQRLDLLLHRAPDVERRHDRAEPARGRDRLQAGHARAEHEHLRRAGRCPPRS